jgi:NADPH:quinone reductase-like Zn-dependent oxidoreductase
VKAIQLRKPGGLNRLVQVEIAVPASPGPGEILVRLHTSSLEVNANKKLTHMSVAAGAANWPCVKKVERSR